jgi:hypothetical protein
MTPDRALESIFCTIDVWPQPDTTTRLWDASEQPPRWASGQRHPSLSGKRWECWFSLGIEATPNSCNAHGFEPETPA